MSSFSEKVSSAAVCQVLAYVIPRFYQKTGLSVFFKAYIDQADNEFKIDIGFGSHENPSDEVYLLFINELKEAEKIVQNHNILSVLHKYTTIEQLKTKLQEEAINLTKKHQN